MILVLIHGQTFVERSVNVTKNLLQPYLEGLLLTISKINLWSFSCLGFNPRIDHYFKGAERVCEKNSQQAKDWLRRQKKK